MDKIRLIGARLHNLKDLNVESSIILNIYFFLLLPLAFSIPIHQFHV